MQRSSHTRIDPWSRWANFTEDSWEVWLDACCKRNATEDATDFAELTLPPPIEGIELRRRADLRGAKG